MCELNFELVHVESELSDHWISDYKHFHIIFKIILFYTEIILFYLV